MSYSLFFEKQVLIFLSKLDKVDSKRIVDKLERLKENPVSKDAKRLVNVKDKVFRIRIGQYRVLYRIENNKLIVVFLVDKRARVYKKR
jgi:mRNA interferase RelE/StbE